MKFIFIIVFFPFIAFASDLGQIEKDSKHKIFKGDGRYHHPIKVSPNKKISLPLDKSENINCVTCHSKHSKTDFSKYLRKDYRKLCVECHTEQNNMNMNHIDRLKKNKSPKKMKSVKTCSACHYMHNSKDKNLTRLMGHKLCITCHTDKKKFHKKHLTLPRIAQIYGFRLEDKKITCLNCHQIHGVSKNKKYLQPKERILKLCRNCHGEKSSSLLQQFHSKH